MEGKGFIQTVIGGVAEYLSYAAAVRASKKYIFYEIRHNYGGHYITEVHSYYSGRVPGRIGSINKEEAIKLFEVMKVMAR